MKKQSRQGAWILLSVVTGLVLLLSLLNGTRLFYSETSAYPVNDLSRIMDRRALPVEIRQGSKKAVLCIHGFPATPANLEYQIKRFKEAGYDVYAPLLPGFGTRPEDLLSTSWRGWYAYLADYYRSLRPDYEEFYIMGMSMGGALTLRLAEEFSSSPSLAPTAVATVAAPVFLNSLLQHGVVLNPALWISRTLSWILPPYIPQADDTIGLPDGGDRWMGYHGLFIRQIHSFKMGLKEVKRDLHRISIPVFLIHAKKDQGVPFQNQEYIFRKVSSARKEKKVMDLGDLGHTHHVLVMYDSTREQVFQDMHRFFTKK